MNKQNKQAFASSREKAKAAIVNVLERNIEREISGMFNQLSRSSSWG